MPHEEQREKNIRLVTEVALDCFLANGIEKTKVADIALRSGLTERSVFRYFETKADLVLAASLLYWNRILERIDRMSHTASDGARPACRTRKNVLVCYSQLYHLDPNGMRFTLDAELTLHTAGRHHEIKNQPPEPFETSGGPMAKAIRKRARRRLDQPGGRRAGDLLQLLRCDPRHHAAPVHRRLAERERTRLRQPDAQPEPDVRARAQRQITTYTADPEPSGFVYTRLCQFG